MILKQCILTQNDCYKKHEAISGKPTGIVVHSTGAPNKTLKRYVQPVSGDAKYNEIMADLGKNKYDNHWNHSKVEMGRSVCVHAFIGVNDNDTVETYQTLPFDICCWGCGSGRNGSYNFNPTARIQFEICEDDLGDKTYFNEAFREAIEFCAYLCKNYSIPVERISSHAEANSEGFGSNHGDCDYWLKKYGLSMDWFRNEVNKILDAAIAAEAKKNDEAGKSGTMFKVQVGAYKNRANAMEMCDALKAKGFKPYLVYENELFKVRVGAFLVRENADDMLKKVTYAGYKAFIAAEKYIPSAPAPLPFKAGDVVTIKSGVTKFADGIKMQNWVTSATLFVRAVENEGSILLVSTEKTMNVYTGRVKSSDVVKK